jgi:hypothetical protein
MTTYSWTDTSGVTAFYKGELFHREDGPAVIHPDPDGDKYWYIMDQLHRLDGPAIESKDGNEWWYKGERIPVNSQQDFEKYLKLLIFK